MPVAIVTSDEFEQLQTVVRGLTEEVMNLRRMLVEGSESDELLTIQEVAYMMRCKPETVREYTRLPKHHHRYLPWELLNGKSKGIRKSTLNKYLKKHFKTSQE